MPRRGTSDEHEATEDSVALILEDAGFPLVDRELDFRTGPADDQSGNLDVCAIFKDALLSVEVKTGGRIDFRAIMRELEAKKQLLADYDNLQVIDSENRRIRTAELRRVRHVAIVLLFTTFAPSPENIREAEREGFPLWNSRILAYYAMTAKALRLWTRYEIMFDADLQPSETERPIRVSAIKAEQPGGAYYLCAMKPLDLLRIAFVFRRSKMETMAYQRIVKEHKIESMTAFLRKASASLPNNVILAIDPEIASQVNYDRGVLTLPGRYCSAWVVDGQHRLYGFAGTKYSDERSAHLFEIPVAVFKNLDMKEQTAMFVDINNNQKKIDPTLLADLSTVLQDLSRKETWPSMLGKRLNETGPFKDLVSLYEIPVAGEEKPLSLAGLTKYSLTRYLLAPRIRKGKTAAYSGPLFRYAQFNWNKSVNGPLNRQAMQRQVELLNRFFSIVKDKLGRKWTNRRTYAVTTYTGANALLLLLNRILESVPAIDQFNLNDFLNPLQGLRMPWTHRGIRRYSNYAGFMDLANMMIRALNQANRVQLTEYLPARRRRSVANPP